MFEEQWRQIHKKSGMNALAPSYLHQPPSPVKISNFTINIPIIITNEKNNNSWEQIWNGWLHTSRIRNEVAIFVNKGRAGIFTP